MTSEASQTPLAEHRPSVHVDVATFLAALEHPFKPAILALRQVILRPGNAKQLCTPVHITATASMELPRSVIGQGCAAAPRLLHIPAL